MIFPKVLIAALAVLNTLGHSHNASTALEPVDDTCKEFIPPRSFCSGRLALNVTNYFCCGKGNTNQIHPCIVDDLELLEGTDAVVLANSSIRTMVYVNEQPMLPGPRSHILVALNNAAVDGLNGATYNSEMFIRGIFYFSNPQVSGYPGTSKGTNTKNIAPRVRKLVNLVVPWGQHFQHAFFEAPQRLELVHSYISNNPDVFVLIKQVMNGDASTNMYQRLFPKQYSSGQFIFAQADTVYPANVVYFPNVVQHEYFSHLRFWYGAQGVGIFNGIRWARAQLRQRTPPGSMNFVTYIGRRQGRARSVINENEMLDTVRSIVRLLGFSLQVLIDPSDEHNTITETFSRTALLFGAHGGAMSEMFLLPDRAHVLEFNKGVHDISPVIAVSVRNCYALQAHGLGLTYWRYVPDDFAYNRSFFVNTTRFLPLLLRALSSALQERAIAAD